MTDPKDAGVDGRVACDSDRGMQEDQRNPIPEHSRQERRRRWPFVRLWCNLPASLPYRPPVS